LTSCFASVSVCLAAAPLTRWRRWWPIYLCSLTVTSLIDLLFRFCVCLPCSGTIDEVEEVVAKARMWRWKPYGEVTLRFAQDANVSTAQGRWGCGAVQLCAFWQLWTGSVALCVQPTCVSCVQLGCVSHRMAGVIWCWSQHILSLITDVARALTDAPHCCLSRWPALPGFLFCVCAGCSC
jgi:hypothetical protein